jgi:predicted MPP superfamily phosphohydrolase
MLPLVSWTMAGIGIWNGLKVPAVKEIDMHFENLPTSLEGYRIVHLTDIHASAAATKWRTKAIVEKTNALNADLICLTGDLFDGESKYQASNIEPIRFLKAKNGIISVTGNHEYYFDTKKWLNCFFRWGLEPLENKCVFPHTNLAVAGISDPTGLRRPDLDAAFSMATNGEFRILLQHRPYINHGNAKEKFDLQLSGHTHGGIAPLLSSLVKWNNNNMVRGVYNHPNGGKIYVSPGTGQWAGFPIRFFNDSEITLITLRKK